MFCALLVKISGERLQDQWSSGLKNGTTLRVKQCIHIGVINDLL